MGFPLRILFLIFYIVGIFAGSITVQERQPILYDSVSPKLRIQGTGFQSGTSVKLTIVPPLTQGQEYNLEVTSDTVLTLILKSKRKWAQVSQEQPQVTLYLSALEIDGTNQLAGTVPIASVIGTPTVTESSQVIYHQSTPALAINGTSLSKVHALVFDPQLAEGTDYTIAKHSYDQILVVLKSGRAWRQEPGPLVLARIDCGGGLLQLSPSTKGVRVAEVQADLDGHGIEVVTNKEAIYQSTPTVMITGSGFNPEGTKLRFYNNLRGSGANYTTIAATPNSLTLQLNPGVKWRENVRQLPGPLTVLAADGGAGWVALGATAAKRGRTIATVYEDPAITPQDTELWQTHSHHLTVTGKGFVMGQRPLLTTTPPLTYGEQYSVTVLNRTAMVLELALDASWCAAPCDLSVLSINTGAGEVALKTGATAGVKIAHVIGDAEAHASGLAVTRSVDLLYQSAHYKPLTIRGAGFVNTMTLMFYPPLMAGEDYTMAVTSGAELTLTLVEGKKWRPDHGPLLLFSVDPDGPEGKEAPVVMGSGAGMQVANILKDPVVEEQTNHIYESHTTMLTIKGSGFSGGFSVGEFPIALQLTPTKSSDFEIVSNTDTVITLKLKPGKKWAGVGHDKTTQLKIKAIDSGAGEEQFKPPIEIAEVHSDLDDDEKGQCDDTCVYALDGECDEDGRGTYYGSWYNEMYGGLEDDDYYSSYYRSSYTSDYGYYGYGYAGYGSLGYSTLNGLAPCDPGTDCTDCGGLRAGDSAPECENTCMFARDGYCDDPRGNDLCKAGSDCQDCGPRSASNFTDHWDTQWFDEDDDFFYDYEEGLSWWDQPTARPAAVDAAAAGGAGAQAGAGGGGGGGGGAKAQQPSGGGDGGSGAMGIITGLVYLLGFGGLAGGAFVAYQYYRGRPIPYLQVPQAEGGDVEMSSGRFRGPITPDVVHTGDEDRSD